MEKRHINMKNIVQYLMAGAVILCATACNDWLDIKPMDKQVLEDFWKSGDDVEATVAACYRSMQESDFMARIILGGELRADNVMKGDNNMSAELNRIMNATITYTDDLIKWGAFYRTINYCNTVLYYAPQVTEVDPDYTLGELRAHEAEALTIRALCYFYLVRLYESVPFVTEPSIDDTQDFRVLPKYRMMNEAGEIVDSLARQKTADYILDYIEQDLLTAEQTAILHWGKKTDNKGRITKNAVRALLADIYLWRFKYDQCIEYCDKILQDVLPNDLTLTKEENNDLSVGNKLQLVSNTGWTQASVGNTSVSYYRVFNAKNSNESIFELQFNYDVVQNSELIRYYGGQTGGNPYNNASIGILSATPLGKETVSPVYAGGANYGDGSRNLFINDYDLRQIYSYQYDANSTAQWKITKYTGSPLSMNGKLSFSFSTIWAPNWIFYRLPEIYLMKAESLVELNRSEDDLRGALSLVNQVYVRSNPTLKDSLHWEDVSSSDKGQLGGYSTQTAIERLVIDERQREFLFEGKRWFDLVRIARRTNDPVKMVQTFLQWKFTSNSTIVASKLSSMDALYLPIHRDELIVNPNLEQNPNYKNELDQQ
jgi:hypothetical protein